MTPNALVKRGVWLLVASLTLTLLGHTDWLVVTSEGGGGGFTGWYVLADWLSRALLPLGAGFIAAGLVVSALVPARKQSRIREPDRYA